MRFTTTLVVLLASLPLHFAFGAVDKSSEVCNRLQQCPSWETVDIKDVAVRSSITSTYMEISQLDSESVRKGVVLYLNSCPDLLKQEEAWGKLYGLFRVFFKIDEGYKDAESPFEVKSQMRRFWSFWGSPWKGGKVDLLWPYTVDYTGQLELMRVYSVQDRTGPGYMPLSDFDSLMVAFGRRFPFTNEPR